tara:strand:- start:684 stop:3392 length:2709 start_codon:yes stop_codon:yes gene_type:complete
MSLQLILHPQTHNGQYNAISADVNEFVVNGINFNGLSSSSSYDVSTTPIIQTLLINAPPSIINTWYRFRSTVAGTPALPTNVGGGIVFDSVVGAVISGVYQRLSNLNVGQQYTISVNITAGSNGVFQIDAYNGTALITTASYSTTVSVITLDFTAASTTDTIIISYSDNIISTATVGDISVLPLGTTPSGTDSILEDGQVICDLYEDEDIPLTLSVDDFKNVAEKVQSYSKAFKLPATKRNNQIFDNVFEVTRADDGVVFNPYVKTQCQLKQDGFTLFEGYLRLIDIQDKEGEISYNVNLYSEVIALADVLGELTFSDLDFSELTHEYNKDNIKNSWRDTVPGITYTNPSTSGFRDANDTLKYPFIDWNHGFTVANGTTSATTGMPELSSLEQAFRPTIQIKYLVERIFQGTPFSYTSNFIDTDADFAKLYMDFNWGEQSTIIDGFGTYSSPLHVNPSDTTFKNLQLSALSFPDEFGYNTVNFNFVAAEDGTSYTFDYTINIYMYSSDDLFLRWEHRDSSGNVIEVFDEDNIPASSVTAASNIEYTGAFIATLSQNDTIQPIFKTGVAATGAQQQIPISVIVATVGAKIITSDLLLQTLRGELGQWDFLKGLMTMFNLVSIPDKSNPNNILIEPYADVFISNTAGTSLADRSIAHDWTGKIDIAEIKLTPLTELNKKTIFKFVEDEDDYAFMNYKNSVGGHLYGSKVYDASGFTILQGEEEIVAEPFAATVPKMLMTQFPEMVTPAIYSYNPDDGTSEGFDNSPRIMYNNGIVTMINTTYFIPPHNGLASENQPGYLQFSHLSTIPSVSATTSDFHFGECQLMTGVGEAPTNNLFNTYWLPYFAELYNADTRTMSIKVNLTPGDLNTLNMYDTVFIKNREFRINKIDYKPNDLATVEFILIP